MTAHLMVILALVTSYSSSEIPQHDPPERLVALSTEALTAIALDASESSEWYWAVRVLMARNAPVLGSVEAAFVGADVDQREHLVRILCTLAEEDGTAFDALYRHFDDANTDVRHGVAMAFIGAPPERVAKLIDILEHGNTIARATAAQALLQVPPPSNALLSLRDALFDDDLMVVASAAQALSRAGVPALPLFVDLLDSNDAEAQCYAIAGLCRMREIGDAAAPVLEQISKQKSDILGAFARLALDNIAERHARRQMWIDQLNQEGVPGERVQAVNDIWPFLESGVTPEMHARLIAGLRDENVHVRTAASRLVAELRFVPAGYLDALLECLSKGGETPWAAEAALCKLGRDAVPQVLDALESPDATRRLGAALALANGVAEAGGKGVVPAIERALCDCAGGAAASRDRFCSSLLLALTKIGPDAAGAMPEIWACYKSHSKLAAEALLAIGPLAIAEAEGHLDDNEENVRWIACRVIAEADALSAETQSRLLVIIEQESPWIVKWAVKALKKCELDPSTVIPVLTNTLKRDLGLYGSAVNADVSALLASFGSNGSPVKAIPPGPEEAGAKQNMEALPELIQPDADETPDVTYARLAQDASRLKALPMEQAVPALLARIRITDRNYSNLYHDALESLGEAAEPALQSVLRSGEPIDQIRAAANLAALGYDRHTLCVALTPLLEAESETVRTSALKQLSLSGLLDSSAVPAMIALIEKRTTRERAYAVSSLGELGEASIAALPVVMELAKPGNADVDRSAALGTLGIWGVLAAPAIPVLVASLGEESWGSAAADALRGMGEPARAAVAGLLDSSNPTVRAHALEIMGEDSESAPSALVDALSDPAPEVNQAAADGLRRSTSKDGPSMDAVIELLRSGKGTEDAMIDVLIGFGIEALPRYISMLEDSSVAVRRAAIRCLSRMGADAREALPALLRIYDGAEQDTKASIRNAVDQITEEVPDFEANRKMFEMMI